eukprot:INCI9932.1.p1 GENE.INCI9932.1~~INCI9932.1.p1  ORF type:complete len:597 (-),score=63.07 INCI9932.1:625-2415(-)
MFRLVFLVAIVVGGSGCADARLNSPGALFSNFTSSHSLLDQPSSSRHLEAGEAGELVERAWTWTKLHTRGHCQPSDILEPVDGPSSQLCDPFNCIHQNIVDSSATAKRGVERCKKACQDITACRAVSYAHCRRQGGCPVEGNNACKLYFDQPYDGLPSSKWTCQPAGCSLDSNQDTGAPHIGGVCFAKAFIDGLEIDAQDVAVEPDVTVADAAIESSQDHSEDTAIVSESTSVVHDRMDRSVAALTPLPLDWQPQHLAATQFTPDLTPSTGHHKCFSDYTTDGGQMIRLSLTGHITNAAIRSFLLLPRSYHETSSGDAEHFPLVLYLHGRGGKENHTYDDRSFFDTYGREKTGRLVCLMKAAGILDDVIILVPDGQTHLWIDSFDKKETSTETNIVHELIPYVDANYRTLRDPAFRMVKGFSMGGYGALLYGVKHPDVFGHVLARSAGRWPSNMNWNRLTKSVNSERMRAQHQMQAAGHQRKVSGWRSHSFLVENIYRDSSYYKQLDFVEIVRQLFKEAEKEGHKEGAATLALAALRKSHFWVYTGREDSGSLLQQKFIMDEVVDPIQLSYVLHLVKGCGHGVSLGALDCSEELFY